MKMVHTYRLLILLSTAAARKASWERTLPGSRDSSTKGAALRRKAKFDVLRKKALKNGHEELAAAKAELAACKEQLKAKDNKLKYEEHFNKKIWDQVKVHEREFKVHDAQIKANDAGIKANYAAAAANAVMLGAGYFNSLTGFMNLADAKHVAQTLHTIDGLL